MEALGEQVRQVVRHERPELFGRRERPVRRPRSLDSPDERAQTVLALGGRLAQVEEHRLAVPEVQLVLDPGDLGSGSDPAVALPVDADEDVALIDVGRVQIARRVGACACSKRIGARRRDEIASRATARSRASSRSVDETKTRSRWSGVRIPLCATAGAYSSRGREVETKRCRPSAGRLATTG